jgi:hypothetical protein
MRSLLSFLFLSMALAPPAMAAARSLGVFGVWGAFAEGPRCYAIAAPYRTTAPEGARPFVAIGNWPRRHVAGLLHVRLSRPARAGSAVLLRIDGRVFQLVGRARDAWAPDARADAEIGDAMRTGVELSVETRAADGTLVRDHYHLRGAATAIDAAALACRAR